MRIILSFILLSLLMGANAANVVTLNVDANQKEFVVSLPSNPTTGYQWSLRDYDQSFLKLIKSYYLSSGTKVMGVGGQMLFKFKLISGKSYPSKTVMHFKYRRPWEPEKAMLKTVFINYTM